MSDELKYDEGNAIAFIRGTLPEATSAKCSDDDILFVIDCIWDWYDDNGLLSIDAEDDDDESGDISELVKYVKKLVNKDKEINLDIEDIELIVKGELAYEESIDDFI